MTLAGNGGDGPTFDFSPHRLWSLWDMLTLNARYFIDIGAEFSNLEMNFYMAGETGQPITDDELEDVRSHLTKLLGLCRDLKLLTAYEMIGRRLDQNKLPRTLEAFEPLREVVFAELKDKHFAYIPSDRAPYMDGQKIASKEVDDAFPTAYYELQRAASCYALEEPTAAVFHAMRAAEIGLRALGAELKVTSDKPIEQMDWMPILNGIHGKIRDIENQSVKARPTREADLAFYGEAAAQFRFFKNAWRSRVAHARAMYSDQQAREIIDHAISFFETLATRLREPSA